MKMTVVPALLLFLSPVAAAQAPPALPSNINKDLQIDIQSPIKPEAAVPIAGEPHHAHVFQNGYVRVYSVTVPPLDATLLYREELPYIFLTLGQADVVDAVQGKPEVHLTLADGDTRYSPGGFAHLLRTDAGIAFHNITVELVHPQASPHNLGEDATARPLGSCPQSTVPVQNDQIPFEQVIPCFETSEVRLELVKVEGGKDLVQAAPDTPALLVAMTNANLDVSLGGQHAAFLHAGDVLWLSAGVARRVSDFLGTRSQFLLLSFKDSGAASAK
jgi:hypothetical protein